jgi:hypothetical protein
MPIRFRCGNCNQLMGISRRKSGSLVRCPACAAQVLVPHLEEVAEDDAPVTVKGQELPVPTELREKAPEPLVFERHDFDDVLREKDIPPAPIRIDPRPMDGLPASPGATMRTPAPVPAKVDKPDPPAPAPPRHEPTKPTPLPIQLPEESVRQIGVVLSPVVATVLALLVVIAVLAAFFAGIGIGWLLFTVPATEMIVDARVS